MKKLALLCLLLAGPSLAHEDPRVWTPKAEFSLEGGTLKETMLWVSGYAYSLTAVAQAATQDGRRGPICLAKGEYVESRVLFDILNKKFKGQRITSEQASDVLWAGAMSHYPCGKAS